MLTTNIHAPQNKILILASRPIPSYLAQDRERHAEPALCEARNLFPATWLLTPELIAGEGQDGKLVLKKNERHITQRKRVHIDMYIYPFGRPNR